MSTPPPNPGEPTEATEADKDLAIDLQAGQYTGSLPSWQHELSILQASDRIHANVSARVLAETEQLRDLNRTNYEAANRYMAENDALRAENERLKAKVADLQTDLAVTQEDHAEAKNAAGVWEARHGRVTDDRNAIREQLTTARADLLSARKTVDELAAALEAAQHYVEKGKVNWSTHVVLGDRERVRAVLACHREGKERG